MTSTRTAWPRCRCGVALALSPGARAWQPRSDPPPDPTRPDAVHSVAILGMDPLRLRAVRTTAGWVRCGAGLRLELVPWCTVGLCRWGYPHLVVDTAAVPRTGPVATSKGDRPDTEGDGTSAGARADGGREALAYAYCPCVTL